MDGKPDNRGRDPWFWAIMAFALALRVAVAAWPVLAYPDELWQYMEPARHIVAGRWVETWDFRAGLRSWLLPMLLSGPMAVGYAIAPLTRLDALFARLVGVAVSMGAVAAAIGLARTISRQHAIVVGVVAGTWFEIVYLSPRTLAEPIATGFALLAALLLRRRDPPAALAAGTLLALACAIRVQFVPALAVLTIGMIGADLRQWRMVLVGGMIGLGLSAAADAAMGAVPFRWVGRNIAVNLVDGKAASFGVQPFWWYGTELWALNGPGGAVLAGLALIGSRRLPVLSLSALANLIVHSLIAHKEYRFIFYTTSVAMILAAIGSVDLWRWAARALVNRGPSRAAPVWLGALWMGWSAAAGALGAAASTWGVNGRLIAAWQTAGEVPDNCGVAIYALSDMPVASYALLSRNVPIYQYAAAERSAAVRSAAFNVLLTRLDRGHDLNGFSVVSCDRLDYFCIFRRPGSCDPAPDDAVHDENRYLIRRGR